MKTQSFIHIAVTVVAVVAVSYATLYFSKAEAVYSKAVGNLSVSQFVPNEGSGAELVKLEFEGMKGMAGNPIDLHGWTLSDGGSFEFDLSDVVLLGSGSIKICEEEMKGKEESCDYFWEGSSVFPNDAGTLKVFDGDNVAVIGGDYDGPYPGETISFKGELNYFTDVYTQSDKIEACISQKDGSYRSQNVSVQKLTNDYEKAEGTGGDIIPPFVYETQKRGLGYQPGQNWPEGKKILENGCQ